MKQILLLTLLALLGLSQAAAQEYEYVPFVREGVQWVYCIYNDYSNSDPYGPGPDPRVPQGITFMKLQFNGDTVINGKTYKAMHKYHGKSLDWENDTIPVFMREENKVVYGIVPDGKWYDDCPIGLWDDHDFYDLKLAGKEFVLYDFNDPISFLDTILTSNEYNDYGFTCLNAETIATGDHLAKRYKFQYETDFFVTEGIGYDGWSSYPLMLWWTAYIAAPVRINYQPADFYLSHVIKDGQIIYKGMRYREGTLVGIDEAEADRTQGRPQDPRYYDLMGRPVGTEVPSTPGIYIHQGKKIVVR